MTAIDPAIFADLAASLVEAEDQLEQADAAWRTETNRRAAASNKRDQRREALRTYVEKCAGARIALLP